MRRAHFRFRRAFIAHSLTDLAVQLAGTGLPIEPPAALSDMADRYLAGELVDFGTMQGRLVSLPGYPFERERFWNPETTTRPVRAGLVDPMAGWLTRDHVIQGRRLLPGAAFLELARSATQGVGPKWSMRDVLWSTPLDATDGVSGFVVDTEQAADGSRCTAD